MHASCVTVAAAAAGCGVYTYADGSCYDGEYSHDKKHGT